MIDVRKERIGRNEALFREVNDRVEKLTQHFQVTDEPMSLLCECGDANCRERIELSVSEYESIRSDSAQFAICSGHEAPEAETIVSETDRYVVVRKHPGKPTQVAAELDPRS